MDELANKEPQGGGREKPKRPAFVFDVDEQMLIDAHGTPEEQVIMDKFDRIAEIYKENRQTDTLDLQITKEAYERIVDMPGIKGEGFSRAIKVPEDDGRETYHLIPSAFISVFELKKLGDKNRQELILLAKGLNVFEGHDIRFELTTVDGEGIGKIEDRIEIFPPDLISAKLISIESAKARTTGVVKK